MRVDELWRYPVKSVGGEPLSEAEIGLLGIESDRVLAVLDERDEVTWAGAVPMLMQVRAVTAGEGAAELILPSGDRLHSGAPDAAERLSAAVHAKVRLVAHRPDNPDLALHVVTTAALRSLRQALPDSAVDATRFRPNLVLDLDATGYPEQAWIGGAWASARCACASPRPATVA